MSNLKDFCQYNSFYSFLIKTKKYKEFFKGKVAKASIFFSIISTVLLYCIYINIPDAELINHFRNIFNMLLPALVGLLGFIVTGLALMASIITKEALIKIDKLNKVHSIVGILFSFYFEGFFIGLNIVSMLIIYFFILIPMIINFYLMLILSFIMSYIFYFAIIYAVVLLGSCINLFFVNIFYTNEIDNINDKKEPN